VFLPESALHAYYCIDYYDSDYDLDGHGLGQGRTLVRDLRGQAVIGGLHRGWTLLKDCRGSKDRRGWKTARVCNAGAVKVHVLSCRLPAAARQMT
jgi:hypothetical protein